MLNLMLNLVVGTLMISITVVIHTFGLMAVTHAMNWITGRLRIDGHRSRVIAMNSVVIGIFVVLTAEVWLWAACYDLLRVVPTFRQPFIFRPPPLPRSASAMSLPIPPGACYRPSRASMASC